MPNLMTGLNCRYRNSFGIDFQVSTIEVEDKIVKLQIWDLVGSER